MNSYKQQVTELYNRRTAYDQEEGTRHPRDANLLLESVPLHSGQKILDIVTGTGLVAIPAAQKVGSEGYVIGIDMSPGMLYQARLKVAFTCPPETAYMADVYKSICAKFLGISLPHILEPLGTPEKCHNLLQQAGFRNIELKAASGVLLQMLL